MSSERGFSLIEIMVTTAIVGSSLFAYMQFSQLRSKNLTDSKILLTRSLVESSVVKIVGDSGNCSFLLTDISQASTAANPNRFNDSIDMSSYSSSSPPSIAIRRLLAGPSSTAPVVAQIDQVVSSMHSELIVSGMKYVFRPNGAPDAYLADFVMSFRPIAGKPVKDILIKNLVVATTASASLSSKTVDHCSDWGEPRMERYTFTASGSPHTWIVPDGVTKIFISMTGGGGSGLGWRLSNIMKTGHSGGYVMNHPVNVVPKERLRIFVGTGGKAYPATWLGGYDSATHTHKVYSRPPGVDAGVSGYAGGVSKVINSSGVTLLECLGGSGAKINRYRNIGGPVASGLAGAVESAIGILAPDNIASGSTVSQFGNYASTRSNKPGVCRPGLDLYGEGAEGIYLEDEPYGYSKGGSTAFGYGSGGGVTFSAGYVTPTQIGNIIRPLDGRDGVVYIDVWL